MRAQTLSAQRARHAQRFERLGRVAVDQSALRAIASHRSALPTQASAPAMTVNNRTLAIHGGSPAVSQPLPPMYPGGMRIGAEEEQAVLEVLRSKHLFRYYSPYNTPSKVDALERAFAAHTGTTYCVAVSAGTASLMCGLAGLGVGPGDEVIGQRPVGVARRRPELSPRDVPAHARLGAARSAHRRQLRSDRRPTRGDDRRPAQSVGCADAVRGQHAGSRKHARSSPSMNASG